MQSSVKKIIKILLLPTAGICFLLALWFGQNLKAEQEHFESLLDLTPNVQNGQYVFNASGCAGCHKDQEGTDRLVLSGGLVLKTQYGEFYVPNISMSRENGIGAWSLNDFVNAIRLGLSPQNQHYYPSFPYTSYNKIKDQELVDLWAYWQTLPEVESQNSGHDLSFPYNLRVGLGVWKKLFVKTDFVGSDTHEKGRYLVEALGHCAECHSPRNIFGGLKVNEWMHGGENPSGLGKVPNLLETVEKWSAEEMEEYLSTGFTPDFDVVGGHMAEVIESTRLLSYDDRIAIFNYLKALRNN